MSSTRQLKSRIRSVKNTKQITKAMQLVAASKMRRAQDADKASTPYTQAANEILAYFASQGVTDRHPLFQKRTVKKRLLILIAADKGLAGAYNSNLFKLYIRELTKDNKQGIKNATIAIGRRAAQFVTRLKDTEVIGVYEDLPDQLEGTELHTVLTTICEQFAKGKIDAVDVIYTQFMSSISQRVELKRILPAGYEEAEVSQQLTLAEYEPSVEEVLDGVTTRLLGAQLFQALLDAKASEWSMRMIAMKNATDNAGELVGDLTLAMNKARQNAITQELAEISGGVEAMK